MIGWIVLTNGEVRYSAPPLLGLFILFMMSLHNEYLSTLKCSVGPLGVMARRMLVLPDSERENSIRCVMPSGPAMVV